MQHTTLSKTSDQMTPCDTRHPKLSGIFSPPNLDSDTSTIPSYYGLHRILHSCVTGVF
ncbi:hypothetical protein FRB95_012069 [Tulasnella sp. JGI-2019a]|nr:hypothetical protein FRB95_012069 [Tulasnella sp. JGI-2019a]